MRVIWTETALAQRQAIVEYFGRYNLASAIRAGNHIEERVNLLTEFPRLGRVGRLIDTRECVVPQADCVIVYRIEVDTIVVARVMHGGRKWTDEL